MIVFTLLLLQLCVCLKFLSNCKSIKLLKCYRKNGIVNWYDFFKNIVCVLCEKVSFNSLSFACSFIIFNLFFELVNEISHKLKNKKVVFKIHVFYSKHTTFCHWFWAYSKRVNFGVQDFSTLCLCVIEHRLLKFIIHWIHPHIQAILPPALTFLFFFYQSFVFLCLFPLFLRCNCGRVLNFCCRLERLKE